MRERWQQWSARYNAMALRERVLVFVALVGGVGYLFHFLVLDPLAQNKKRLTSQLAEARQNIKTTEALIRVQETPVDPDAVKRTYSEALRKQLAEIDQSIQGLQKGLVPPERMAKLLEDMLTRGRGLHLVSLRTLPVQRFETPATAPPPKPGEKGAKPAARDPERSIYQHTYEISLQGSYNDLHDYLTRLESIPAQMFWGRITFDTQQYPKLRVTLIVHTLSLSKAWLVV